ncbi:hypothetical protein V9K67_12090 [Paraflavisolibacter sp. H34]|uniref:hypothetical protein n=1 Tax=Huijunlia imazamoxiresistens TaxID=3127457 RepID=UPI00301AEE47
MERKDAIITEDGQRLTVENGEIVGTEDTGGGLAYEGEPVQPGDENRKSVPAQNPHGVGGDCPKRDRDRENNRQ